MTAVLNKLDPIILTFENLKGLSKGMNNVSAALGHSSNLIFPELESTTIIRLALATK